MDVNVTCFICLHVLSAWTLTIKPNMKRFMIYMTTTGKRAQADARLTQKNRPQSQKREYFDGDIAGGISQLFELENYDSSD